MPNVCPTHEPYLRNYSPRTLPVRSRVFRSLLLRNRLTELDADIVRVQRRMATDKDDNRYQAIAAAFDTMVAELADAARRIAKLAIPKPVARVDASPEAHVDGIMATIDVSVDAADPPAPVWRGDGRESRPTGTVPDGIVPSRAQQGIAAAGLEPATPGL